MDYRSFKASLSESAPVAPLPTTTVVSIREEMYSLIPESTVVDLIKRHHPNVKITNTLIESYRTAASTRKLTSDKTVLELRKMNPADAVLENHTEFQLKTGQVMVISEQTQKRLNKILGDRQDILDAMSESKETFMDVINLLED